MARQRRGGGFKPPELRGTLGTLLRTTLQQAGVVRDALERGARDALGSRLDDLRRGGRRGDAVAELGEIVLDLIRRGEIDVEELPEVREVVAELDELDAEAEGDHEDRELRRLGRDDEPRRPARPTKQTMNDRPAARGVAQPSSRRRFDDRDNDGTVSSSRWSPPSPSQPARVWRPPMDPEDASSRSGADDRPTVPPPTRAGSIARRGGISFEDEDLADYMHPDDVPAKESKDD